MLTPLAMVVWLHFTAPINARTIEVQRLDPFTVGAVWTTVGTYTTAACTTVIPRIGDPYFRCALSQTSQFRYRKRECNPLGCNAWEAEENLTCVPTTNLGGCPPLFPQQP